MNLYQLRERLANEYNISNNARVNFFARVANKALLANMTEYDFIVAALAELAEYDAKQTNKGKNKGKNKDKAKAKLPVVANPPKPPEPPEEPMPWTFRTSSSTPTTSIILPTGYVQPVVQYTPDAKACIDHLVHICSQEVGWFGAVRRTANVFLIHQIYIPEQVVHSTETLIDGTALAALFEEMLERNEDPNELFYWGHSHVNMQVTPSGQDEKQVQKFLRECPYFIRGIYNKRGDAKVDFYDRDNRVVFECTPATTQLPVTDGLLDSIEELAKTNLKYPARTVVTAPTWPADSYNPYPQGFGYDN